MDRLNYTHHRCRHPSTMFKHLLFGNCLANQSQISFRAPFKGRANVYINALGLHDPDRHPFLYMVKAFNQTTNGPVNALLKSRSTVSTKTRFAKFDIVLKSIRVISGVTGHFVPRSFRTQVTSYHFGNFVPTFWSFHIQ